MMAPADVATVVTALRSHVFSFTTEADLQEGIGQALTAAAINHQREATIATGDRVDFLVGAVGVEVKIGGSPNSVIRQLHRYAQAPGIDALLLITSRMKLANAMPTALNGKTITTYCTAGDAL